MAVHRLDDTTYKELFFDEKLWEGINTASIFELVNDLYPQVKAITSKSENQDFAWFYGRVGIEGKGKIKVIYPYTEEHSEAFTLKNVSFSTFPFLVLTADKENFTGWFDGQGNLLEDHYWLLINEDSYPEVTGFIAKFE